MVQVAETGHQCGRFGLTVHCVLLGNSGEAQCKAEDNGDPVAHHNHPPERGSKYFTEQVAVA